MPEEGILARRGVRGGKAMIATAVPGRLIRYARQLVLRQPPAHSLVPRSWPGLLQNPSGAAEVPHSSLQLV